MAMKKPVTDDAMRDVSGVGGVGREVRKDIRG
ncbi:MAG: hypothetical protein V8R90_01275 [Eubacterium sp.]